jgi:tetraacyldisaccharide 4'-kinase
MNDRLEALLSSNRDHPVVGLMLGAAMSLHPLLIAGVRAYIGYKARNGRELPRPVMSVGNITVGGTGKTTLVRLLLEHLEEAGFRVVLLYRGYKRRSTGPIALECGIERSLDPRLYGDEPYMVARRSKSCSIYIGGNRYEAGLNALKEYSPDVFILDDGFQHVSLKRDLDIVLIDSTDPFGSGRLLPFGLLREPLSALQRADLIVLTRCNHSDLPDSIEAVVHDIVPSAPIVRAAHEPQSLLTLRGVELGTEELRGRQVYLFSGIGNHASFLMTALECGARIKGHRSFANHHWYSRDEIDGLARECRSAGAEWLVTTEKDLVRIPRIEMRVPLCAILVRISVLAGAESLWSMVEETLERRR